MAGKGKFSPCAYTNDAATPDIRSLLHIKRKTNGSAARKLAAERAMASAAAVAPPPTPPQPLFPLANLNPATSAALNAQLGLLALQHQQLQAQLVQQQQKALLEQQHQALIEQHQHALLQQKNQQLQQRLAETQATQSLTAASLGQGGNAAASAVVAVATAMASSPTAPTNPATAALAALPPPEPSAAAVSTNPVVNVLESAANLKSLLDESGQQTGQDLSQLLLQRLPSQSTIFPESSLLSLNSFFSKHNSVADLEKR